MRTKVFWFFFLKKELLAFFLLARLSYGSTIKTAGIIPRQVDMSGAPAHC
jgi:hypothetical protein